MKLSYQLRGYGVNEGSIQGKEKVYFTCHPDDFGYYDEIVKDIFKTQSCAIFFCEDMSLDRDDADMDIDLGRMQLFVIPITAKFLYRENKARLTDFAFAREHHIPILPLIQEPGLENEFNRICGDIQFLDKNQRDLTAIPYEEKLKKHLDAVLLGDELMEKIRAEFDEYIFLSYRKKDRRYAQELIRLIHKNGFCRDIAVWYDEFLKPGESFNNSIKEAMKKSKLFTLAVTPNLVSEENYVMTVEYPEAKKEGKEILACELVKTDLDELKAKYDGIPDSVNAYDSQKLSSELAKTFSAQASKGASSEMCDAPEHLFLIGLAYLNGIDVEIDTQRGIDLIKKSAEASFPAATKKLASLYYDGSGVPISFKSAIEWQKKTVKILKKKYGLGNAEVQSEMSILAGYYRAYGENDKATALYLAMLLIRRCVFGKYHEGTLESLSGLAYSLYRAEHTFLAVRLCKKALKIQTRMLGKDHPDTLTSMCNLADMYRDTNKYNEAISVFEEVVRARRRVLGEEDRATLNAEYRLAHCYYCVNRVDDAVSLGEEALEGQRKTLGLKSLETLDSMNLLAFYYKSAGKNYKAIEIREELLEYNCEIFGEESSVTLDSMRELAHLYHSADRYEDAVKQFEKRLNILNRIGAADNVTNTVKINMAYCYRKSGRTEEAISLYEGSIEKVHGDAPGGKSYLRRILADCYYEVGRYKDAIPLYKKAVTTHNSYVFWYELYEMKGRLANCHSFTGNIKKAIPLYEEVMAHVYEGQHAILLDAICNLADCCQKTGDNERAVSLYEKALDIQKRIPEEHRLDAAVIMSKLCECRKKSEQSK